MSDPIRIAVVGCGYWGINYVRLVSELAQTEIAVVCDKSEERLKEVRNRFGDFPVATDPAQALAEYDIDAAIIATTASTHYGVARQFLEAGIPVLIEKPLTILSEEAEELIDIAERRNVVLMVGHIFTFNPGIRKVKEYINKSETGTVYYLHARRTNLGPIRHDVNALWDLAAHDISIFNYLLDSQPDWVSAVGGKVLHRRMDDVGFATLHYPNGVLGHIHVSWADPTKVREVVVVGSKVRIAFNDLDLSDKVRVFYKGAGSNKEEAGNYGEFQSAIHDGDILIPSIEHGEPLKNQVLHFIDCIQQHIRPITDGNAGLEVIRSLEAIDMSIQNNGVPISTISRGILHAQ